MKKAYETTIRDFEIQLQHCGLFEFRYRKWLNKQLEIYRSKLNKLYTQLYDEAY